MLPLFGLKKRKDALHVGDLVVAEKPKMSGQSGKSSADDEWIIAESEAPPDTKRKIQMKDTKSMLVWDASSGKACEVADTAAEVESLKSEVHRLQSICAVLQYRLSLAESERDAANQQIATIAQMTTANLDAHGSITDFVQVLKTLLSVTFELERSLVNALCDVLLTAFDKCTE